MRLFNVYLLAGFLCFCWLKHEEDDEEPTTTVQKHSRQGYNLAALLFSSLEPSNPYGPMCTARTVPLVTPSLPL